MAWLTRNVLVQESSEPLATILSHGHAQASDSTRRRRLLHIVNPYDCPAGSKHRQIQEITFDSLSRSRDFASSTLDVDVVAVGFSGDYEFLPDHFQHGRCLERSVLDVASFSIPRKLPLLFDILEHGGTTDSQQDFIVFTNVYIVLMPQFYLAIGNLLDLGFDALTITRRTIPFYDLKRNLLPLMSSDFGKSHPGFDCFVFPTRFAKQFIRSDACVGASGVMRSLLYNLVGLADRLLVLKGAHLTYHLGNERAWRSRDMKDYTDHNERNARRVYDALTRNAGTQDVIRDFCLTYGKPNYYANLKYRGWYVKFRNKLRHFIKKNKQL